MVQLFKIGFLDFGIIDVLDILLVGLLIYELYKLIRGSVASRIFLGILILYAIYQVVKALGMQLLTSILDQFMGVGMIAALILFQQEIRKFLLLLGKGGVFRNDFFAKVFAGKTSGEEEVFSLQPAIDAAKTMSLQHTGGLIVFARSSELKFYAETGDAIDAVLSKRLLLAIFHKQSPLHDGSVIVANGRIKAARCILPVSDSQELAANLGLRHRAAIGVTEVTDAVVLVVSEERGQMAIAFNGRLETNLSSTEVRARLNHYLFEKGGIPARSIREEVLPKPMRDKLPTIYG